MVEYLDWVSKFEYLSLPDWLTIVFYILLAGLFYLLRMYIVIIFMYKKIIQESKNEISVHGEDDTSAFHIIFIGILAVIMAPVIEEISFRCPILWFVQKSQYGYALVALIILSVIFALIHLFESYGKYKDGSEIKKTKTSILNTAIGGIFYGILVILTVSLWPAIFLHVIWNILAILIYLYKEKFDTFALSF